MEKEYVREQVRVGHSLAPIDLAEIVGKIRKKVPYIDRARVWFNAAIPPGKVYFQGQWRNLHTLHFVGNARQRNLGRLAYCESALHRR